MAENSPNPHRTVEEQEIYAKDSKIDSTDFSHVEVKIMLQQN